MIEFKTLSELTPIEIIIIFVALGSLVLIISKLKNAKDPRDSIQL